MQEAPNPSHIWEPSEKSLSPCFWRNLRSSASSWAVVKGVRGLRLVLCLRRVQAGGLSRPEGPREREMQRVKKVERHPPRSGTNNQ